MGNFLDLLMFLQYICNMIEILILVVNNFGC